MDNSSDENSSTTKNSLVKKTGILAGWQDCAYFEVPKESLRALCGANDQNLRTMTQLFASKVSCHGNRLNLLDPEPSRQELFWNFLNRLLSYMDQGMEVRADLLDALYRASKEELQLLQGQSGVSDSCDEPCYDPADVALTLNGKKILPRNRRQYELLQMLNGNDVIFALGPAGTGKTFLAVAYGLSQLLSGQTKFLLLSRPVVEAGESLGFLPGGFDQKISPYMLPLFDAMRYLLKAEQVAALEAKGMIEIAPLAYMRGRSLRDAIVILDEAQNATAQQIKMLLTRLGEGSKALLTGDPSQSDLSSARRSGLYRATKTLTCVEGVATQYFRNRDIIRSPLVRRIICAYAEEEDHKENDAELAGTSKIRKKAKA